MKMLVKCYTSNSCFMSINGSIADRTYHILQNYIASFLRESHKLGKIYSYKNYSDPVFRGVSAKNIKLEDYELGSFGFWPAFSSTSSQDNIALRFAKVTSAGPKQLEQQIVFQIYLSGDSNKHATNLVLPEDWSFYKESEVLLLPFFSF